MTEVSSPNHFLLFSNANVAMPHDALRSKLHHPAALGELAMQAGFDGVDLHAMYAARSSALVSRAVNRGELIVGGLHQSFLDTNEAHTNNHVIYNRQRHIKDRVVEPLAHTAMMAIMPALSASSRYMHQIQVGIGRALPAVMYPRVRASEDALQQRIAGAERYAIQPTDDVLGTWGMAGGWYKGSGARFSVDGFLDEAAKRKYDLCLDTTHVRRVHPGKSKVLSRLTKDDATLEKIAGATTAMHIALFRKDALRGQDHIPAKQELAEILAREAISGELRTMIDAAKEHGRVRQVVLELRAPDLAEVMAEQSYGRRPSHKAVVQGYALVGKVIRNVFAE